MNNYASWLPKEELQSKLTKISKKEEVEGSGIQLSSDKNGIYIDKKDGHSLVIGSTGSAKTQTVILPLVNLSMLSNESFVVNDVKAEIYKSCADELKKRNYNVVLIDFDDLSKGNYWNPFEIIENNYEKNKTNSEGLLELLSKYIFTTSFNDGDPFWKNTASDFFCGLCTYYLSKNEKLSFEKIFSLADSLTDDKKCAEFIKELDKNSSAYSYLASTIKAPMETRNSIIAVFNSEVNKYVSNKLLSSMLSKTDFNINDISSKTAIFIVPNRYKKFANLQAALINELYESLTLMDNKKKVNFLLDDFDEINEIQNLASILNYARGCNICFTCNIKSIAAAKETYKGQNIDLIKLCFSNIIYLYSNDNETLKFVSDLCGNQKGANGNIEPLVTIESLKVINPFEAIIIKTRLMPVKTRLMPSYEIDWGYKMNNSTLPERKDI